MSAPTVPTFSCRHCERPIVQDEDGRWVDPAAPTDKDDEGNWLDDAIWRETCDANDTSRPAEHEPDDDEPDADRTPEHVLALAVPCPTCLMPAHARCEPHAEVGVHRSRLVYLAERAATA